MTIRNAVLNKLKTLPSYNFPSARSTEGIEREKLSAILVGFATEQEFSGTTRRLDFVVAVVVYSWGDIRVRVLRIELSLLASEVGIHGTGALIRLVVHRYQVCSLLEDDEFVRRVQLNA